METALASALCTLLYQDLLERPTMFFDGTGITEKTIDVILSFLLEKHFPLLPVAFEYAPDDTEWRFTDLALFDPNQPDKLIALIEVKVVRIGFIKAALGNPNAGYQVRKALLDPIRQQIARQSWAAPKGTPSTSTMVYQAPGTPPREFYVESVRAKAITQLRGYGKIRPEAALFALIVVGDQPYLFHVPPSGAVGAPIVESVAQHLRHCSRCQKVFPIPVSDPVQYCLACRRAPGRPRKAIALDPLSD